LLVIGAKPVSIGSHTAPVAGSTQYSLPVSPPNHILPLASHGAEAPGSSFSATRSTIVRPQVLSVAESQQKRPIEADPLYWFEFSRCVHSFDPETTPGPLMSVVPNPLESGCRSDFG
jgi:hypothetical protein